MASVISPSALNEHDPPCEIESHGNGVPMNSPSSLRSGAEILPASYPTSSPNCSLENASRSNKKIQSPRLVSRLSAEGSKGPSPIRWFPRTKQESFLERKIRMLQEKDGVIPGSLDETLGDAPQKLGLVEREKLMAAEAAEAATRARRIALIEASWCRILDATGIPTQSAVDAAMEAEMHAAQALAHAISLKVAINPNYFLPNFNPQCKSIFAPSSSSSSSTTTTSGGTGGISFRDVILESMEDARAIEREVVLAVKAALKQVEKIREKEKRAIEEENVINSSRDTGVMFTSQSIKQNDEHCVDEKNEKILYQEDRVAIEEFQSLSHSETNMQVQRNAENHDEAIESSGNAMHEVNLHEKRENDSAVFDLDETLMVEKESKELSSNMNGTVNEAIILNYAAPPANVNLGEDEKEIVEAHLQNNIRYEKPNFDMNDIETENKNFVANDHQQQQHHENNQQRSTIHENEKETICNHEMLYQYEEIEYEKHLEAEELTHYENLPHEISISFKGDEAVNLEESKESAVNKSFCSPEEALGYGNHEIMKEVKLGDEENVQREENKFQHEKESNHEEHEHEKVSQFEDRLEYVFSVNQKEEKESGVDKTMKDGGTENHQPMTIDSYIEHEDCDKIEVVQKYGGYEDFMNNREDKSHNEATVKCEESGEVERCVKHVRCSMQEEECVGKEITNKQKDFIEQGSMKLEEEDGLRDRKYENPEEKNVSAHEVNGEDLQCTTAKQEEKSVGIQGTVMIHREEEKGDCSVEEGQSGLEENQDVLLNNHPYLNEFVGENELEDVMVERLKELDSPRRSALANIVATRGLINGLLRELKDVRESGIRRISSGREGMGGGLGDVLVKHVSKLESEKAAAVARRAEQAKEARVNERAKPEKGNDADLAGILVDKSTILKREAEKRENIKKEWGKSFGRVSKPDMKKSNAVQGNLSGERAGKGGLSDVLVKHVSKLEKEKMGAISKASASTTVASSSTLKGSSLRRETKSGVGGFGGAGLGELLSGGRKLSRLEKEKLASSKAGATHKTDVKINKGYGTNDSPMPSNKDTIQTAESIKVIPPEEIAFQKEKVSRGSEREAKSTSETKKSMVKAKINNSSDGGFGDLGQIMVKRKSKFERELEEAKAKSKERNLTILKETSPSSEASRSSALTSRSSEVASRSSVMAFSHTSLTSSVNTFSSIGGMTDSVSIPSTAANVATTGTNTTTVNATLDAKNALRGKSYSNPSTSINRLQHRGRLAAVTTDNDIWKGQGLGEAMKKHVSKLERDKESWKKAEEKAKK